MSLVGLVVNLVIAASLMAVMVGTLEPHSGAGHGGRASGQTTGGPGGPSSPASATSGAEEASLATTARSITSEATALAEITQTVPSAVDPLTPGRTYVQAAAGDLHTGGQLVAVSPTIYQLSHGTAAVCLTLPAAGAGSPVVTAGRC